MIIFQIADYLRRNVWTSLHPGKWRPLSFCDPFWSLSRKSSVPLTYQHSKELQKEVCLTMKTVLKSNSWIFLWNLMWSSLSEYLDLFVSFDSCRMPCHVIDSTTLIYSYTCRSHETRVISTKTRVIATDASCISFPYPGIFVQSDATRTNRCNGRLDDPRGTARCCFLGYQWPLGI